MNKFDVLTKLGVWKIKFGPMLLSFDTELQFTKWVKSELIKENIKVIFTYNPYDFEME